jgi:cytochrome c peroxidase
MKIVHQLLLCMAIAILAACSAAPVDDNDTSTDDALSADRHRSGAPTKVSLGALIFNDTNLSEPAGQACATCHAASHGFADPRRGPTSAGAVKGRFGVRNAPSINYASFIPPLSAAGDESGYGGGLFWDGRARTLQDQAVGPLLNPLEMNNSDTTAIQTKLKAASYAPQILALYGPTALDTPDAAMAALADAIASFETSGITNRFTSKYDAYLAQNATLTASEARGLKLFEDPKRQRAWRQHHQPEGLRSIQSADAS